MTAGLTSPQGGEEPGGVVKKWIFLSAALHREDQNGGKLRHTQVNITDKLGGTPNNRR